VIPIVFFPDDVLVSPASPLERIDRSTAELTSRMVEAMHGARGIGLAGPQIGRLERLFVVHVPDDEVRTFINPRITATSPDESKYEEGCLSIPGVYADISRPRAISVEAWDAEGTFFTLDAEGLLARVILHEYDHLEGTLFLDHLSTRRRERLLRTYRKPDSDPNAQLDREG
jgi:peptide deformylase